MFWTDDRVDWAVDFMKQLEAFYQINSVENNNGQDRYPLRKDVPPQPMSGVAKLARLNTRKTILKPAPKDVSEKGSYLGNVPFNIEGLGSALRHNGFGRLQLDRWRMRRSIHINEPIKSCVYVSRMVRTREIKLRKKLCLWYLPTLKCRKGLVM